MVFEDKIDFQTAQTGCGRFAVSTACGNEAHQLVQQHP
jgi:hypothetical protein